MATSSLTKSFVIDSKKEASNFVKLISEYDKAEPLKDVSVTILSPDRLKEIINATRK